MSLIGIHFPPSEAVCGDNCSIVPCPDVIIQLRTAFFGNSHNSHNDIEQRLSEAFVMRFALAAGTKPTV